MTVVLMSAVMLRLCRFAGDNCEDGAGAGPPPRRWGVGKGVVGTAGEGVPTTSSFRLVSFVERV